MTNKMLITEIPDILADCNKEKFYQLLDTDTVTEEEARKCFIKLPKQKRRQLKLWLDYYQPKPKPAVKLTVVPSPIQHSVEESTASKEPLAAPNTFSVFERVIYGVKEGYITAIDGDVVKVRLYSGNKIIQCKADELRPTKRFYVEMGLDWFEPDERNYPLGKYKINDVVCAYSSHVAGGWLLGKVVKDAVHPHDFVRVRGIGKHKFNGIMTEIPDLIGYPTDEFIQQNSRF